MFDNHNKTKNQGIAQGNKEYEELAKEAAVSFANSIRLVVNEAVEGILGQMTAAIAALHTKLAEVTGR